VGRSRNCSSHKVVPAEAMAILRSLHPFSRYVSNPSQHLDLLEGLGLVRVMVSDNGFWAHITDAGTAFLQLKVRP
jgi:hypothetical protein